MQTEIILMILFTMDSIYGLRFVSDSSNSNMGLSDLKNSILYLPKLVVNHMALHIAILKITHFEFKAFLNDNSEF